ncbi:MAG: PTS sugar transporter subunit IIA [Propionibacteriales bacterium]|nr:PTS sugar transporter subunit IIA [Propionibacteriales bacterium]
MTSTSPLAIAEERIVLRDSVQGWRDAIEIVGGILVDEGNASREYVDAMIASVAGPNGTYIDLGAGIALAHARPENGVESTGLSVLHLDEPVLLADDPAHPITVFIALAAVDSSGHLDVMKNLARVLTDESLRQMLLNATTSADIVSALSPKE